LNILVQLQKTFTKSKMIDSLILTLISGAFLGGYKWFDSDKDMERFYHKNSIHNYYLLKFAVIVLSFCFFFHGRHVAVNLVKMGWRFYKARAKHLF